ncbi:MAG: M23 family metallopeptidase [Candidatus Eremiobacteraeota bacterium]|nr:M23 family metallopeptidase [Candidatus Eremiobacteraeota bacterium]
MNLHAPVSGRSRHASPLSDRLRTFASWLFCPYRRVLIKIVPHHAEAVYKLEFSHLHLALAGIGALALSIVLLVAHVADLHAAEGRVRALQAAEARQRQQLSAFTKQTNMLWQRVGKLQRDNEEIHRLTRVIVPKAKAPTAATQPRAATGTQKQFGMRTVPAQVQPSAKRLSSTPAGLTPWRKIGLWLHTVAGLDSLGFAAEAAQLSSLTSAVDETGQQTSALESRIRVVAEAKIAAELARERYLAAIPSIWPTIGFISSGFGYRSYPDYGFHKGLDIVNDYGAPVYATAAGVVMEAGWYGGYGYRITIDHGNGLRTMYAHNSRLLVSEGAAIKKGQQIATVGSTGFATGPHVHYQLELWGKPVDPTPYLTGSVKVVAIAP